MKQKIFSYVKRTYQVEPDYPFRTSPDSAVLRHSDNGKWFALLMNVEGTKLGLKRNKSTDILNLKCSPMMSGTLREQAGILPAYHMNRENWISVLLDGTVAFDSITPLIDLSFQLTASKKQRTSPSNWLVPANPKYCDITAAVNENPEHTFYWKQSSSIAVSDTVYLYVTAPVSAILFKCKALEVDIPYHYEDKNVRMTRVMSLQLIQSYECNPVTRDTLIAHGITTVRGPRYMPVSLIEELELTHKKSS